MHTDGIAYELLSDLVETIIQCEAVHCINCHGINNIIHHIE